MFKTGNKKFYLELLQKLVEENKFEIFAKKNEKVEIIKLSLGRILYKHPNSYGRILKIKYLFDGVQNTKKIFVKIRKKYDLSPDTYMKIYEQFKREDQFMPKLYFYKTLDDSDETIIGMEYISGMSLRNQLLFKAFIRRASDLSHIFFENGKKMRLFHASQREKGKKKIGELLSETKNKLKSSRFFSASEKKMIQQHLLNIEQELDASLRLPLIHIHHDWTLRNILVKQAGKLMVIDLDSVEWAPAWCWNDVVYFLFNIESQIKYWPFIKKNDLKYLWEQFLGGYLNSINDESLTKELLGKLFYLIKLDHWIDSFSISTYYNRGLGKLYVRRFKKSLQRGHYTIFLSDSF